MIEKETLAVGAAHEQRRARARPAKAGVRLVESRHPQSLHYALRSPHPPPYCSRRRSSLPCLRQMDLQGGAARASRLHPSYSQPSKFQVSSVDRALRGVKERGRRTMWRSPRPRTERQAARSLQPNLVVSTSPQSCYLRISVFLFYVTKRVGRLA